MPLAFLDTNILLRHLRQDDPVRSPTATALLERIERGELQVRTSDLVLFETVFTLQRGYHVPREQIAAALLHLLELPAIVLPGKRLYRAVFARYVAFPLGFADCYHVELLMRLGIGDIFSFDTHFDRIPGITRRES